MINVKYDDAKVDDANIISLSKALQKIVSEATTIPETFVYADSPKIKIDVAPIEVFIEMSASIVPNKVELFEKIQNGFVAWKRESGFEYPVTITLTPVDWKFEVGL